MLQCVAVCVAMCAAICCNTLQHTCSAKAFTIIDNACNTLQYTSTHSNTLEHTATHLLCNTPAVQRLSRYSTSTSTLCNTPQHTATHCNCNALQHKATHLQGKGIHDIRHRLQKTAKKYNTLQHSATHLQHTCSAKAFTIFDIARSTSQNTATHCITLHHLRDRQQPIARHCNATHTAI